MFLQRSGVGQHGAAQIRRGRAGINGTMKSVLYQQRKIAAVIDVGVRQHHRGHVFAREREVPVALLGFLAVALILAAIQQIAIVADHQLMHGAGDHLGRAPECQFHPLKNTVWPSRIPVPLR